MSALDLTAAVEAVCADEDVRRDWNDDAPFRSIVAAMVTVLYPLMDSAIREQIAAEIEAFAQSRKVASPFDVGADYGLYGAARIARTVGGAK